MSLVNLKEYNSACKKTSARAVKILRTELVQTLGLDENKKWSFSELFEKFRDAARNNPNGVYHLDDLVKNSALGLGLKLVVFQGHYLQAGRTSETYGSSYGNQFKKVRQIASRGGDAENYSVGYYLVG